MPFPDPASAEAAFYSAFRNLDISAMQEVWMDSNNTSCIHPGGALLQGTAAVLDSWREIFRDSAPPRVEHRLVQSSVDAHLAVHTVEEHVSTGSGAHEAVIIATNMYVSVGDGWYLLAHHASLPLVESHRPTPSNAVH